MDTLADNELSPFRIGLDGDGNLLIASNFTATTSDPPMDVDAGPGQVLVQEQGDYDLVVLKYSTDGDFLWTRQIGNAGATMFGDNPILRVNDQGDVFFSGSFSGSLDLDPGAGMNMVTNNEAVKHRFLVQFLLATSVGLRDGRYWVATFRDIRFADDG
jgi:hypothetical protein